jgi:hypothetical protein
MAPFDAQVLRLLRSGQTRPVWPQQEGPGTALGIKSSRGVAVLAGGALPPRLAASTGSEVAPSQYPRAAGPRFLGRRVDPQTEFGRLACGERMAKPAPRSSNQLNPRSTNK